MNPGYSESLRSMKTLLAMGALLPPEMDALDEHFHVLRLWQSPDPEQTIKDNKDEIVAILSTYNGPRVSSALIEALPNLGMIAQFGAGYDNIDVAAARARDIPVTTTPDILTSDTADIALSLMLATSRRIVEADMFTRVGKWRSGPMPLGRTMRGKRVGILGAGRIGQAIAVRAAAFEMDIVYHGRTEKKDLPYPYYSSLEYMAKDVDFLVVSCTGGEQTKGLVDKSILKALGSKGFLINVARGSVVVYDDLIDALQAGTIAGAGLDVYPNEPAVPEELISMDQVVLLPHIGSATIETRTAMGRLTIENLLSWHDGKVLLTPLRLGCAIAEN